MVTYNVTNGDGSPAKVDCDPDTGACKTVESGMKATDEVANGPPGTGADAGGGKKSRRRKIKKRKTRKPRKPRRNRKHRKSSKKRR